MKNNLKEIKILIEECRKKGFEYGKPISYLEFRNNCSKEEFEKEILELKDLVFAEKQTKESEKRHKLYFVYTKKSGRVYVLVFREKIRVVTIYPLGRNTIKKYLQAKFKKNESIR